MPGTSACDPPPGPQGTSLYSAEGLTRFVADVLGAVGTSDPDARWMAELIVAAELAGHECHGLRRLPEYVDRWRCGKADPAATPRIDLDRGALVRVDGRHGFGHVTMRVATDLAVDRARAHGIAGVAVHRTDHAGRFADYCERAAAAGVATLIFANDAGGGQSVAPPGATEPRLSTNPVAAGVPRAEGPHLVLDMATSVVAAGRLSESTDRGDQIPAEWVTSTGVLKPMGGVKGFGIAPDRGSTGRLPDRCGHGATGPGPRRPGCLHDRDPRRTPATAA